MHFDEDHFVTLTAWGTICRQADPGRFVTKLCYSLIGYDLLAACMQKKEKKKKGSDSVPGEFVQIIMRQFEIFLRKRGYPLHLASQEMLKLNTYIHRACSYARNRAQEAGEESE